MSIIYYTFRLDIEWEVDLRVNPLADYIKANVPKYLIFKELGDITQKPHLQGVIGLNFCVNKMRKMFKALYPQLFNRTSYSIADIEDWDKYMSYICKQNNILVNNVLDQEQIDKYNKDYLEKTKNKPHKLKNITFTQKCFIDYKKDFQTECEVIIQNTYNYNLNDEDKRRIQIAHKSLLGFILKRLGNISQVFDQHILHKIYNGVLNSILQDHKQSQNRSLEYWSNVLGI